MNNLHYLLMQCHSLLSRQVLSKASQLGLTSGQPKILECLWQLHEADQKTIASFCQIEQATVGSILLRMEKSDLIVRKQHEGNRRSLYVSLTKKGEAIAAQMIDIFQDADSLASSHLNDEETKQLLSLLTKVSTTLKDSQRGVDYE